jgi:hypothetical protein
MPSARSSERSRPVADEPAVPATFMPRSHGGDLAASGNRLDALRYSTPSKVWSPTTPSRGLDNCTASMRYTNLGLTRFRSWSSQSHGSVPRMLARASIIPRENLYMPRTTWHSQPKQL